ncbi:MAG: hypothetical protein IKD06_00825 [Clostridia bacterium]|nr:hypothetical protein [Clostridia bacterium]
MFGYIRLYKPEMTYKDYARYHSLYCGMCQALKRVGGPLARWTLQYDFVFLGALRMLRAGEEFKACNCRCPLNPFKKVNICVSQTQLEASACASLLLAHYQLKDDAEDCGSLKKRLRACLLLPITAGIKRRVAKHGTLKGSEEKIRQALERLHAAEQAGETSLDVAASPFAELVQWVASEGMPPHEAADRLAYHVGRWIYIADAWEDLQEDTQNGAYNPLKGDPQARQRAEFSLNASLMEINRAVAELPESPLQPIFENLALQGLPRMQKFLLEGGHPSHIIKRKDRIHESL